MRNCLHQPKNGEKTFACPRKTKKSAPQPPKKTRKITQFAKKSKKDEKKLKKSLRSRWIFDFLALVSSKWGDSLSGLPAGISQFDMQCVGRVEISLSCWLRQTGGNSRYLLRLELTIGLDAGRSFPKAPAKTEKQKY